MAFPSNTIAVDWSLIEIWCCGSTRSSSSPQEVVENRFSKSVEASGISTENSVQMGKIGIADISFCHLCEHKCANHHSLREHKKKFHPGEFLNIQKVGDGDWKFQCEFCDDFFRTKDEVLNHVKTTHKNDFDTWIESVRKWKKRIQIRKPSIVHVKKMSNHTTA